MWDRTHMSSLYRRSHQTRDFPRGPPLQSGPCCHRRSGRQTRCSCARTLWDNVSTVYRWPPPVPDTCWVYLYNLGDLGGFLNVLTLKKSAKSWNILSSVLSMPCRASISKACQVGYCFTSQSSAWRSKILSWDHNWWEMEHIRCAEHKAYLSRSCLTKEGIWIRIIK